MASSVVAFLVGFGLFSVTSGPLRSMLVVVLSGIFHLAKLIDYEEAIVALIAAM